METLFAKFRSMFSVFQSMLFMIFHGILNIPFNINIPFQVFSTPRNYNGATFYCLKKLSDRLGDSDI